MSMDPKKDPSNPSLEYQQMASKWRKLSAALGGLDTLRMAQEEFLPRHPGESREGYETRLLQTRYWPATAKTLSDLSSRPFTKPVQLADDVPAQLVEFCENVDQNGSNLDVFAREWFSLAMGKGLAWVLVDAPRAEGERTVADDRALGIRPYWVLIPPESVVYVRSEYRDGKHAVVEARILETVVEDDEFAQVTIDQVRILTPGRQVVWRKKSDKDGDDWFVFDDISIDNQQEVPLVRYSTDLRRRGNIVCDPPLEGLADLNLAHYRSMSDQVNALTVARFPLLACSGDAPEGAVVLSPNKLLYSNNPEAKFYYVEHSGAALGKGAEDLAQLEEKMEAYGGMLLRRLPGSPTATGEALDTAQTLSHLESAVLLFKDALEIVLAHTAEWLRMPDGGSVVLPHKIAEMPGDQGSQMLLAARSNKDISGRTLTNELKRRGHLPDDYDYDEDQREVEAESKRAMDLAQSMMDLDPGARDDVEGEEDEDEDGAEDEDENSAA